MAPLWRSNRGRHGHNTQNNFRNPIFLEVFDLFTRGLQDRGLRPLLVNLSGQKDPAQSLQMLQTYSVDAVIVASSTLPPSFAEAFRDAGVPVVNSFGRHTTSPNVHVVGIDNVECGRMAARTLIDHGYRKLAFLGGPKEATSTQDRLAGFLEVVRATAGVSQTHSFAAQYSFEAGFAEMQHCIKEGPAEAYFCGDDVLSIGDRHAQRPNPLPRGTVVPLPCGRTRDAQTSLSDAVTTGCVRNVYRLCTPFFKVSLTIAARR